MEGEHHVAVVGLREQLLHTGNQFPAVCPLLSPAAPGSPLQPDHGAGFIDSCHHYAAEDKDKQ